MRKWFIIFLMGMFLVPFSAEARWYNRRNCNDGCYTDFASGIIGTATGVMLADKIMNSKETKKKQKPKVHIYEPEGKCYTIVSKKTGKIKQECVENASDSIIYVD